MSSRYTPQTWVNDETVINATRMNHIEDGIEALDQALDNLTVDGGDADTLDGHSPSDFLGVLQLSSTTISDVKTVVQNNLSNIPTGIASLKVTAQSNYAFGLSLYANGKYRIVLNNALLGVYDSTAAFPIWTWTNLNDGGNAITVNNHTVGADVPSTAKFSEVKVFVQQTQPESPSSGDLWIW